MSTAALAGAALPICALKTLVTVEALIARVLQVLIELYCLKLLQELLIMLELDRVIRCVILCVGVLKCTTKRYKLVIVAVVELRELTHAIAVDVLTVWNAIILVLIALTLVLRLFIVFLFVIAALVEQWRIRVVQNVLRVRPNFPKRFNVALRCTVNSRISVIK